MSSEEQDPKTEPVPEAELPDPGPEAASAGPAVAGQPAAEGEATAMAPSKRHAASALEEARREIAGLKDRYLRTAAELENQRKRLDREKSEYYQYALAELLKDLLAISDNFERAMAAHAAAGGEGFEEGIGLIHKQMLDLLRKQGVTPIDVADAAFDPTFQQAIVTEASAEVEEPRVVEEMQRGYLLHDRLLRPALVKVLVPKKD
ncbi:MAG: nucleotide exchange factor GrpE [Acidobacteriota bacterium]|nr:nucleotide exchange factor GrpE [Acidobacteriota bacterium]